MWVKEFVYACKDGTKFNCASFSDKPEKGYRDLGDNWTGRELEQEWMVDEQISDGLGDG